MSKTDQPKLHIVILTFNSHASIGYVIDSCSTLAAKILVVDSFSTDRTVEIAQARGGTVIQHEFENYSVQRNWAQEQLGADSDDWVLHLDADELLSDQLASSISAAVARNDSAIDGYLVQRLSYFLGKPIKFGQINPSWHLRLYKADKGFCEDRRYDQHFVVHGKTTKLLGLLLDLQMISVDQWTSSHNRWASAEAQEAIEQRAAAQSSDRQLRGDLKGDLRMKKRWLKNNIWYKCPLFVRPFLFFGWSYFIRLGFLDGVHGLVYHVLQSFWFRFLVDAKIYEARQDRNPIKDIAESGLVSSIHRDREDKSGI